jgi:hypothetical protein
MPFGKCALCLEIRELRDSHFLPAGFYRIMREGSGEDPVLLNKSAAFMSSAQARTHLLCGECERRFNGGGEDWVLKNCWRSPTNFPLHSALMGATPFLDDQGFRSYEGQKLPGVDIEQLAYFARAFSGARACTTGASARRRTSGSRSGRTRKRCDGT